MKKPIKRLGDLPFDLSGLPEVAQDGIDRHRDFNIVRPGDVNAIERAQAGKGAVAK